MNLKGRENKTKYLKAPTPDQIKEFISELGVSYGQFEMFYGIPNKTIVNVLNNKRRLPSKYWHVVYEKVKPAYGVGFLAPIEDNQPKVTKLVSKVTIPRPVKHNPLLDIVRK